MPTPGEMPTSPAISTTQALTLTTTYFIYSFDGRLMAEYDQSGVCTKEYIYLGNKLIGEYKPQESKYYYYHSDQINSTRVITDDNGNKVYDAFHGPFGEELYTFVDDYEPELKFSGKDRDKEHGLDYFGARYHDHFSYRSPNKIIKDGKEVRNPDVYNCHSYVWHDSQGDPSDPKNKGYLDAGYPRMDYSPSDDMGDYKQISPKKKNKVGDRVIYYIDSNNNGKYEDGEYIVHSANVTGVDKEGNTTLVKSKMGIRHISENHPDAPGYYKEYRGKKTSRAYYTKKK